MGGLPRPGQGYLTHVIPKAPYLLYIDILSTVLRIILSPLLLLGRNKLCRQAGGKIDQIWAQEMETFGPGGLLAPPVVPDGSVAGHCFHLLFSFSSMCIAFHTLLGYPRSSLLLSRQQGDKVGL